MPLYNGEKYLSEAIESVLNQSYKDFELIIIDDASTDSSKEIALSYQKNDGRIKVTENKYEKGLAGALNTGIDASSSDYIARTDADDINKIDRLETQLKFLEKNKDIDIVGGGYHTFGSDNSKNIFHPKNSLEIAWKFLSNTYFCHPTVMFRRIVLNTIPHYPNTGSEDFAFFSKIIHKHKGFNIPKILIDYRQHDSNYSNYARPQIQDSVYNTFMENYKYYMHDDAYSEIYFKYKKERILLLRNYIKMLKIEFRITNSIRKSYNMPSTNLSFIGVLCKAWLEAKLIVLRSVLK